MRNCLLVCGLALATLFFSANLQADLIIVLNGGDAGEPGTTAGGGQLSSIMRAAADEWEYIFAPDTSLNGFTLTINYGWGDLAGSTLGLHQLVSQNNFPPHRETEANITFDNTDPVDWFLDNDPLDNSEYSTYNEVTGDLGGGTMITEKFHNGASGDAAGAWDLFSVALHEIGHALGLSSANLAFIEETRGSGEDDDTIEVEGPLPFAGSIIPVQSNSAHLNSGVFSQSLMTPSIGSGIRKLPSHADILANAQVSRFNAVNLSSVPEPSGGLFVLLGTFAILIRRKRIAG